MRNRKTLSFITFLFIVFASFNSCIIANTKPPEKCPEPEYPPETKEKVTINQGLWGNVWFWEGDFYIIDYQPDCPPRKITPVIRNVYAFEPTSGLPVDSQVIQVGYSPFYSKILTKLVDSTQSDSTGFFQLELPPGKYSFFVKEDSLFYANLFDGYGLIFPVIVVKDSVTKIQIDITYKKH